jgi:hypothetical protein
MYSRPIFQPLLALSMSAPQARERGVPEASHLTPPACATTLCSGRIRLIEALKPQRKWYNSDTASRNSFGGKGFKWNVCLQVTLIKVIRGSVFGRVGFARPLPHFGRVHYALAARWCARAASRPRLRHRCKSGYRLCARVWAIKAPIAPSMTPRIVVKANFCRPSCIALKGIRQFRPSTVRNVHY